MLYLSYECRKENAALILIVLALIMIYHFLTSTKHQAKKEK